MLNRREAAPPSLQPFYSYPAYPTTYSIRAELANGTDRSADASHLQPKHRDANPGRSIYRIKRFVAIQSQKAFGGRVDGQLNRRRRAQKHEMEAH